MRRQLRLDGDQPHDLLRQVREQFGPDARVVHVERVKTTPWWSLRAVERLEVTVEVPATPEPGREAPPPPVVELGVDALLAAGEKAPPPGVFDDAVSGVIALMHTTAPLTPTHAELRRVGVPEALLPSGDPTTLTEVTRAIPAPSGLPTREGALIAVVGAGEVVEPVARTLNPKARMLRVNAAGVNRDPQVVARIARRRAGGPGVVGVQVAGLGGACEHARQVLEDLDADLVLVAVDARVRVATARDWLAALTGDGVHVDLAAHYVTQAQQPASVLGLGVPVALIDGAPATPARWAAILAQALGEG